MRRQPPRGSFGRAVHLLRSGCEDELLQALQRLVDVAEELERGRLVTDDSEHGVVRREAEDLPRHVRGDRRSQESGRRRCCCRRVRAVRRCRRLCSAVASCVGCQRLGRQLPERRAGVERPVAGNPLATRRYRRAVHEMRQQSVQPLEFEHAPATVDSECQQSAMEAHGDESPRWRA